MPSINAGGPAVAPSSSSTAPAFPVGEGVATATATVLDAANLAISLEYGSPAPVVPRIGVELGSLATGAADPVADAADASSGLSIDVPGVISVTIGRPAAVPGGDGSGAGGISIGGGLGLGGTGTSISNPGIILTLPGLTAGVVLPLSSPLEPIGKAPDPVLPSIPTNPALPSGSIGTPASPPSLGETPVTNPPTRSTAPGGWCRPRRPPRMARIRHSRSPRGALFPLTHPVQAMRRSTGSTTAFPREGVETATAAQAAATSTAAALAASSTSASSVPGTTSGLDGGLGNEEISRVGRQHSEVLAGPSSVRPADPDLAPAELLPGDLDGLERALGRLMQRFDQMGEDLAGRLAQFGTLEMLLSAGMVVLACEVVRRWERRRQLGNPRAQIGASRRPGPAYRPRGCPFGRPGPSGLAGRPQTV